MLKNLSKSVFFQFILLAVVAGIVFLPNLSKATIYRDDWYYTLDRIKGGSQVFFQMFSIDRPARGPFFEGYYRLFGIQPAPYHAMSFLWRLVLGLAGLWLFRLLFPRRAFPALFFALFLVLYPGYSRWMEGFEDQPTIASLTMQTISIALSLAAVRAQGPVKRFFFWSGAILIGWAYIALVDYSAGMEAFRLVCILVLVGWSSSPSPKLFKRVKDSFRAWLPAALIPVGWLIWRFLIFHNTRPETNVSLQLSRITANPLLGLATWAINYIRSVAYTLLFAWTGPAFNNLFELRISRIVTGIIIAISAAGIVLVTFLLMNNAEGQGDVLEEAWPRQAVLLGTAGVLGGVLPVVLANRWVMFQAYSHYAVPASLASALFITGVVYLLPLKWMRAWGLALVFFLAAASQYSASGIVLAEEQAISSFWQQMVWRAPGIREDTELVARYPGINFGEDIDAVNGPANFLYYPGLDTKLPVTYHIVSRSQYPWAVQEFRIGGSVNRGYRTHSFVINGGQVLVVSQASAKRCLHVIDRRWPWYMYDDSETILLIGPYSDTSNILPDANAPVLDKNFFGRIPTPGWCYYFEKADLAVQMQDWLSARSLGQEVMQNHLLPYDLMEWMPFLQSAAALGDLDELNRLLDLATKTEYQVLQICNVLKGMQATGIRFSDPVKQVVNNRVCSITGP
jgi:hypothetical protein